MRTLAQLTALTALLTAALTGPAAATATATATASATAEPGTAPAAASQPREVNQGYSIPVGAVTDLGALPVLGGLGLDFARLMGV
ncbi:hypothetical protein [Kitasatospora sp. NPDC015120]|uniref:hypothetical protein n=1 Tax=Kitasatospora sp. NPDC015120 TaxID=3364023 RepID=UPI0036F48D41